MRIYFDCLAKRQTYNRKMDDDWVDSGTSMCLMWCLSVKLKWIEIIKWKRNHNHNIVKKENNTIIVTICIRVYVLFVQLHNTTVAWKKKRKNEKKTVDLLWTFFVFFLLNSIKNVCTGGWIETFIKDNIIKYIIVNHDINEDNNSF